MRLTALSPRAGTAAGLAPLAKFIYDFTQRVYQPGTADFRTVINAGSTDAWGKIATTLANPGDGVLCEEWTYPSALACVTPPPSLRFRVVCTDCRPCCRAGASGRPASSLSRCRWTARA